MRPFSFLVAYFALFGMAFAAVGFDYPTPSILRLFNDVSVPYCINVNTGVQMDNCGNEWANSTWCVGWRANANPWNYLCRDGLDFNYSVSSDNATYANVTFYAKTALGNVTINYNLTQNAPFINLQPNITIKSGVVANTTGRFSIITHDIKINNSVSNDWAWFDGKNFSLALNTTTNNTANASLSNSFVLYDANDSEQIFYGWEKRYPTKLTVWPQPGYGNRQTNLTWELGVIQSGKSYFIPMTWRDAELQCDVGSSVDIVTTSKNVTNTTSTSRMTITDDIVKTGSGGCTYYLYYKTTQSAKYALVPSSFFTGSINLPIGVTVGNTSQVTTTAYQTVWTVLLGGMNSTGFTSPVGNFSFTSNVSGAYDGSKQYQYVTVWDTLVPNATINTTNLTSYTLGNLYVNVWGIDETNLRVVELYSNESGGWKYTAAQNASTNSVNKTISFNFTRSGLAAGCYLYGAVAKDTSYDSLAIKWNVTKNYTFCVSSSGIASRSVVATPIIEVLKRRRVDERPSFPLWALAILVVFALVAGAPNRD